MSENVLVGLIALFGAGALALRAWRAWSTGEIPLYRERLSRAEAGPARFRVLLGLNLVAMIALLLIAADLLLGLGLRR